MFISIMFGFVVSISKSGILFYDNLLNYAPKIFKTQITHPSFKITNSCTCIPKILFPSSVVCLPPPSVWPVATWIGSGGGHEMVAALFHIVCDLVVKSRSSWWIDGNEKANGRGNDYFGKQVHELVILKVGCMIE